MNKNNYGVYSVTIQNFIGPRNPRFNGIIRSVSGDLPVDLNFIKMYEKIYVEYDQFVDNGNPRYNTTIVDVGSGENVKRLIENNQFISNNVSSIKIQSELNLIYLIIIKYDSREIFVRVNRIN